MPELTPEQIKRYNTYRAEGLTPERSLSLATKDSDNKYNPVLEAGVDNVLFGPKSLVSSIGKGLKSAFVDGPKAIVEDARQYGAGFAAIKAPLTLAAGAGRGVGDIVAGLMETADDLTGETASGFLMPVVEGAVNSDVGQYLLQKAVEFDKAGRGIPGDILDATNLLGITAIAKTGVATSIKEAILGSADDVVKAGLKSEVKGGLVGAARKSLSDFIPGVGKKIDDISPSTIEEAIESQATGKTTENIGSLRKPFVQEDSLLTPAEKRRLVQIAPEKGNAYIEAFKKSELDDTAPSIFDIAVDDTLKVVKKYKEETSKVGGEIGKIKAKLSELSVDPATVSEIKTSLIENLKKKNVFLDKDGQFTLTPGKNSPFTNSDIKALNDDVLGALKNIEDSSDMNELLLAIESLDNKINFSKDSNVSGSLQGASKTIRGKLKEVRDAALTPEESAAFDAYAAARTFTDEFLKSDSKVSVLLNRLGTKHSRDSIILAKELKRITGIDIQDFSALARILTEASVGSGRNKSLLQQHMINAGLDVAKLTSPSGILSSVGGGIIRSVLNVDKLKEIEKAINTVIKKP